MYVHFLAKHLCSVYVKRVKGEKNNLMMLISDNGKGFNMVQTTEGNGLKNMKKRAEEIDGQLFIES